MISSDNSVGESLLLFHTWRPKLTCVKYSSPLTTIRAVGLDTSVSLVPCYRREYYRFVVVAQCVPFVVTNRV